MTECLAVAPLSKIKRLAEQALSQCPIADMASNNQTRVIKDEELISLRRLLSSNGSLDFVALSQLSWEISEIDDKSLFDDDAERIGSAFRKNGATHFFVAKVSDLISQLESVTGYQFTSDRGGVEEFQGPSWHELNLEDCLLFSFPLFGVVLRSGIVAATFMAGEKTFVAIASGKS